MLGVWAPWARYICFLVFSKIICSILNRFVRFLADRPLKLKKESLAILMSRVTCGEKSYKSEQIEQIIYN